ncbi:MAG TPA: Ku protein [Tepidisphaeraceae bacterium]|nr:Ku protein [Tepidisphaeraceae bacterium]
MARPIWKGTISFGLVSIPIQLETAVREKTVSFHMLSKDGTCRLRRKLYCPDTGKEFDFKDTTRGIEVGKDRYVIVDESEIDKLKPEKGKSIEIEQFVELKEIDPIYFDAVYFITPADGSGKSYRLLYEAMKNSGRIGVARFVMRERQQLAALRVMGQGIVLHTMHYADEVLSLEDSLPASAERSKPNPKELAVANQLIEAMTHPLDLSEMKDDYRESLEQLIERKRTGKKTVAVSDDHDSDVPPPTINLMDALKRSLSSQNGNGSARHPRGNGMMRRRRHRDAA